MNDNSTVRASITSAATGGSASSLSRRTLLQGTAAAMALWSWPQPAHAAGKPVSVAIGADLTSLDPHKFVSGLDHAFFSNVFESLMVHDQDGTLIPALAESVTVSEDGLVHTFALRKGVTWHNGDPFSAEDVRFSWTRSIDPAIGNSRASVVSNKIKDIEIVDPYTVRMILKAPDASLHQNFPTYFYMVPKNYIEKVGDEAFGANPIGTGPFRYTDRKASEFVKFAPYEAHYRIVPKVGEVTLKIIPDDQTRMAQAQTGESDIVTSVPLIFAARMSGAGGFRILRAPSFSNAFMVFNNRGNNEDLQKVEVRRAINLAIDRESLMKALTFGFATPHKFTCTPGMIGCDAVAENPYRYDPQEARRLLTEAGFNFDRPLKIVGPATGRVTQARETVEAVAQSLASAGIRTEIEILEFGTWATVAFAKPKDPSIDMYLLSAGDASPDPGPRMIRTLRTGEAMSFFSNDELDDALAALGRMRTAQEYEQQMRSVYLVIHKLAANVPLWSYDAIYAVRDGVTFEPFKNINWPVMWYAAK